MLRAPSCLPHFAFTRIRLTFSAVQTLIAETFQIRAKLQVGANFTGQQKKLACGTLVEAVLWFAEQ